MTLLTHLLFVATVAVFSLAGCTGEDPCVDDTCAADTEPETRPDLVRVEIEVLGNGTVFVDDGPETSICSGDQGLCSFSFPPGTDLVISSDTPFSGDSDWQDVCVGLVECHLTLDWDEVVVANFDDESLASSQYANGLSEDSVIVDPIPEWNRHDSSQELQQSNRASAN